jgi:hypothetical protein
MGADEIQGGLLQGDLSGFPVSRNWSRTVSQSQTSQNAALNRKK